MTADPDGHPTRPTSGPEYWAIMARENVAGMESVLAYKFEQVERLQAQVDALEQRIAELEGEREAGKVEGWWLAHDELCERGRIKHCYFHEAYKPLLAKLGAARG